MGFDFKEVVAATDDERIRAWSVEQAIDIYRASDTGNAKGVLDNAAQIEQYVRNGKGGEFVDEGTLYKVQEALLDEGLGAPEAQAIINRMQNAGILFRERVQDG